MPFVPRSVGSAVGWRTHEILADFEDSPVPDRFRKRSSRNLSTVRMSLRKRMPLKQVEMNFADNPTWESLEAKEKSQPLWALSRTAKNMFGVVSQKIQKSCHGPTRSLATSLAKASVSGSKKQPASPRTPQRKSSRLAAVSTPTSSTQIMPHSSQGAPVQPSSHRLKKDLFPPRRSRRAAALRSPYASPVSASHNRQFDCDLELVSTGVRQLKRLSRAFNEIILEEERDQAIANYCHIMAQNLRAAHLRSQNLSKPFCKRTSVKLCRTLGSWADCRFKD